VANTAPPRRIPCGHDVFDVHPIPGPAAGTQQLGPGHVVGVPSVRTACAFSGSLRGLRLVLAKWRCLIPPTSGYPYPRRGPSAGCYANANRWAVSSTITDQEAL